MTVPQTSAESSLAVSIASNIHTKGRLNAVPGPDLAGLGAARVRVSGIQWEPIIPMLGLKPKSRFLQYYERK